MSEEGGSRTSRAIGSPLVVAAAAVAYLATAARHVLGGDTGEFATLLVTGGAAHPPGYPLYVLYLRLFRWIPAASPAHAAALATALVAIASIAVLQRACRAWGASEGATAVATVTYALSPLAWHLATAAEVFALNALLAGAIVWIAAPGSPLRGAARACALGLLAGLGMSHHHTIVALAPIGVWGTWRGAREARTPAIAIAGALGAFAVGLTPYAYVYACAQRSDDLARWTWGGVRDLATFYSFFRRGEYPDANLSSAEHVTALLWRVTTELDGLPLLALAAGLTWGARSGREPATRAQLVSIAPMALLVTTFLLAGPAFATIFNLPLEGIGAAVTERFYLLPMLVLVVIGARALDALLGPAIARPAVSIGATGTLLAAALVLAWPQVRARHRPVVAEYVETTLRAAPPNAVLLGTGDERFGGFLYARYALGLRPDVTYVTPHLLLAPWYRRRVSAAIGVTIPEPRGRSLDVPAVVAAILGSGRPLALTNSFLPEKIEARFPTYPLGTLIYVVPRASDVPDPAALEAANVALAAAPRTLAPADDMDPWALDVAFDYARPWLALAAAFERAGDAPRARANRDRAAAVSPSAP